jgi:chloride channel 3/4/5
MIDVLIMKLDIELAMSYLHSPRVILVEQYGVLRGLLTVKDVMRFLHELESTAGLGASASITSAEVWDEYRGTLRTVLERTWEWASERIDRTVAWARTVLPAGSL